MRRNRILFDTINVSNFFFNKKGWCVGKGGVLVGEPCQALSLCVIALCFFSPVCQSFVFFRYGELLDISRTGIEFPPI